MYILGILLALLLICNGCESTSVKKKPIIEDNYVRIVYQGKCMEKISLGEHLFRKTSARYVREMISAESKGRVIVYLHSTKPLCYKVVWYTLRGRGFKVMYITLFREPGDRKRKSQRPKKKVMEIGL